MFYSNSLVSPRTYEFSVNVNGKSCKEYEHHGKTFIEGRSGSEYTLHFFNNSNEEVLVVPSVDGLSILDGKPASEKSNGYVVKAFQTLDIPGWTLNKNKVAKFKFCPQHDKRDESYVQELKNEGFDVDETNQGVIGVMVFKKKPIRYASSPYSWGYPSSLGYDSNIGGWYGPINTANPIYQTDITCGALRGFGGTNQETTMSLSPQGISLNASGCFASASHTVRDPGHTCSLLNETGLGTAFGEQTEFKTVETTFEKASETPEWIGVITYDTLVGLKKRGVVIEKNAFESAFPNSGLKESNSCYIPKSKRSNY